MLKIIIGLNLRKVEKRVKEPQGAVLALGPG
jgi:hypothetical protein